MSRVARDLYRKKLTKLLGAADDEAFCQLVWAVAAIQSGRASRAKRLLIFPPAAATEDFASRWSVYPWELESLVNELLAGAKPEPTIGYRKLNCGHFDAVSHAVNLLRNLENAEDGIALSRTHIFDDISRLGHRQFEWQLGFDNRARFYRSAELYTGPKNSARFLSKHGISIADFVMAGFATYAFFKENPVLSPDQSIPELGLSSASFRTALALLSNSHLDARAEAQRIRSGEQHTAYRRSILRQRPCIAFGSGARIRAPLHELVFARITSGLYYDVDTTDTELLNEIGDRFERYCRALICHGWPSITAAQSYRYKFNKNRLDTPDVLLRENGGLRVIVECKTKRMPYAARFAENAGNAYETQIGLQKIAYGVFQVWRFISHIRRGFVPTERLGDGACGLVITLEPWVAMARGRYDEVVQNAKKIAAKIDPEVSPADMKPVAICSADDFEWAAFHVEFETLAKLIDAAASENWSPWFWSNLKDQIAPDAPIMTKPFPFEGKLGDLLPWWKLAISRAV